MFIFDFFDHSNFTVTNANSYVYRENTYGALSVTLDYKDWGFLTASARNDWTSTPEQEQIILYPSVSLSVLPFDALSIVIKSNFLKVRLGFGTSAGYPGAYSTRDH